MVAKFLALPQERQQAFYVDYGVGNTKLKLTEEPEILVKINTKYHDDLFNISICLRSLSTVIVLVYLVPHALINHDVNVTRKITEV